jgi:hypothetical protein
LLASINVTFRWKAQQALQFAQAQQEKAFKRAQLDAEEGGLDDDMDEQEDSNDDLDDFEDADEY